MKNRYYQFDTAIWFIDFHRLSLSIDKNHLIAIDFYRDRFLSIDYSGYNHSYLSQEPSTLPLNCYLYEHMHIERTLLSSDYSYSMLIKPGLKAK